MKKTQVDFLLIVSQLFQKLENGEDCKKAVSYTHLTLPTTSPV